MPPLMLQETSPTTQLMPLAPNQTSPPIKDKTLELNLRRQKPTTLKIDNVDEYKTKWKYNLEY
jgi:hypothetical protein